MDKFGYVVPFVLIGCHGSPVAQLQSDVQLDSVDLFQVLENAQRSANYATTVTEVKKVAFASWFSEAQSHLTNARFLIDGQVFTDLKSFVRGSNDMLHTLAAVNRGFGSLGSALRYYGVQANMISKNDVRNYMRIARSGLNYAKTGDYELGKSLDPPTYAAALNVAIHLTAATRGTAAADLVAATTHGYLLGVYVAVVQGDRERPQLALSAGDGAELALATPAPTPSPTPTSGSDAAYTPGSCCKSGTSTPANSPLSPGAPMRPSSTPSPS